MADISGNLAGLALEREAVPGAELLAREALTLSEKLGRQELMASNCQRLAKALVRQGKPPRPYPMPGARWRSIPGSDRPSSKPPARPSRNASLDHPLGFRNETPP
jgi:hypothetical protein